MGPGAAASRAAPRPGSACRHTHLRSEEYLDNPRRPRYERESDSDS